MIFNSISKQINHNYPPTNIQKHDYNNTHYIHRETNKNYNFHKTMDYQVPSRESALSQMNQKITENLEYLKYKDYMRQKDLHSSRISNSSNRSLRSNRTLHSQSNSRVSMQSPSRKGHILTKNNQHYFPQVIQTKLSHKPWETQATSLDEPVQNIPIYRQKTQYRQFLRKPITIENYNEKYGLNKKYENMHSTKPQNMQSTKHENMQSMNDNSNVSQRSKASEFQSESKDLWLSQQTFASPISKDFLNIYDNQPKLKKPVLMGAQRQNKPGKSSSRVVFKQQIQQKQNQSKLSPLQVTQSSNNKGLITAAVLIGLGVLLLILQILN